MAATEPGAPALEPLSLKEVVRRLPRKDGEIIGFAIAVASRRNSGKTWLVTSLIDILTRGRHPPIDHVFVMSGSAGTGNGDYTSPPLCLPEELVVPFDEDRLQRLYETQLAREPEDRPRVLLVLDDVLGSPEARYSSYIDLVFVRGRHVNISVILISQVANTVLSPLRIQQADLVLYSSLNRGQLERLFLATKNIARDEFVGFSERYCGMAYVFGLLDNTNGSADPADLLTLVRAPAPPKRSAKKSDC